jgi:6-pyruvoyltetrahydropterin/6-carboxytetrahydropterin synthase
VAKFRVCKSFVVESGHMLSKHPERCRYPHGHTRTIEVVVSGDRLDERGMLADFTALKLAVGDLIEALDHAMVVSSEEPLLPALRELYPDGIIVFPDGEPTTEAIAKYLFDRVASVLAEGCERQSAGGAVYRIVGGSVALERIRVWETPTTWAEYGE